MTKSVVLFHIDDLTNKWIDINSDENITSENDFGYACLKENGIYHYLNNNILCHNLDVKLTFFTVVGAMSPIITESKIREYSYPINYNKEFQDFLRYIHNETHHEIAYHGLSHGIPGKSTADFIQEWQSYKTLEDAVNSNKKGRAILKEVLGEYPKGGKYCGYKSNEFSDESIDFSGFKWWCRYDNKTVVARKENLELDTNPLTAFQNQFFGKNSIVDIPTVVYSNLLNKYFKKGKGLKAFIKRILRPILIKIKLYKRN